MEEWKEYKLEEICMKITDGSHSSPRAQESGYPMFSVKDMLEYGFDYSKCKYISKEDFLILKQNGCVPQKGDVLVAKDGSYLKQIFVCKQTKEEGILSSIAIFRPNELIDSYFLCYLLKSPQVYNYIASNCVSGSALPRIVLKDFKSVKLQIPSKEIQINIVSKLKSLDDKIECNRRINDNFTLSLLLLTCFVLWLLKLRNDNLEKQAQTLFKSWFVDFEPFMDGEFVESEMGMIPKGWKVGVYDDIISETISGDWGKEKAEGNYTHRVACIRGCDFQDIKNGFRGKTPERFILEKNFRNKHFCDKDILVEISGGTATVSTGRVCPVSQQLIDKYNGDVVCTNFCRLVRPKKGYGAYLYYSWFNKYNNKVMFGYENGTSGIKNFRIKDFTSIEPVVLPPIETIIEFQNVIDSIQKQIQTRGTESQNLAQLRDTLLPRLMSGELKVNELETIKQ